MIFLYLYISRYLEIFSRLNKSLIVAISDPNNIYVLDAIKFITGCPIQPVISPESAIQKSIDSYYAEDSALSEVIKGLEETYGTGVGLMALIDSSEYLEIALKEGSAAAYLNAGVGDEVRISGTSA